jgi:hypothetical protein
VIDQAKGILMGRHGMSADAAFDLLGTSARVIGRDNTRAGDRDDSRAQPARRRRRDER